MGEVCVRHASIQTTSVKCVSAPASSGTLQHEESAASLAVAWSLLFWHRPFSAASLTSPHHTTGKSEVAVQIWGVLVLPVPCGHLPQLLMLLSLRPAKIHFPSAILPGTTQRLSSAAVASEQEKQEEGNHIKEQ
jgi:hypothetical protein